MKKDITKNVLKFSEIFCRASEQNEDVRRQVFFYDVGTLVEDTLYEAINDIGMFQSVCGCVTTGDEDIVCKCVQRRQDRDGGECNYMNSSILNLDDVCEAIMKVAGEIVESLKENSFLCECDLTACKKYWAEVREKCRKDGEASRIEVEQSLPDEPQDAYEDSKPSPEQVGLGATEPF